jgi:ribosomal protein S18 acetylase RimI-like enzyme
MAVEIRPVVIGDAASYRRCWDAVAKERRYLVEYKAAPLSDVRKSLRASLRRKTSFLVAVDGDRVVGWAAVFSGGWPPNKDSGHFEIGLLRAYRRMGLGTKLAAKILKMSRLKFDSIFCTVLRENVGARKLSKKMGFKLCGTIARGVKLAYGFDDLLVMQKRLRRA